MSDQTITSATESPVSATTPIPSNSSGEANKFSSWASKAWHVFRRIWGWTAYALGSIVLVLILLGLVFGFWVTSSASNQSAQEHYLQGSGSDKIAVLNLSGEVGAASGSVPGSSSISITEDQINDDLQQAADDDSVKAVILRVDSPGGSAVESDQIYQRIENFKRDSHKPVVASFGDTAASGGYYLSTAADKIVANPATLTGSIGVIMEYYDASGLLQKIGVNSEVVKSGQYKDIGSFARPSTPEETAILQQVVNQAYDQFVSRVADGRHMDVAKVKQLGDGRIYTGSQAKENGLVDDLGNLDQAINVAKNLAHISDATVVEYEHGGLLQSLLGGATKLNPLEASLNKIVPSASASLQYRWQP